MAEQLDIAVAGDRIQGDELQDSINRLKEMANGLDDLMTDDLSVTQVQSIGQVQVKLRALAGSLVNKQIDLLTGEAKVTAEHINAAVKFANDVVKSIADVKARLEKIAALLDFFGAVVTGNGKTIVQAAVTLKGKLS